MSYSGDIGLYLSGGQVAIPECGIFITPPTAKQIAQYGEDKFFNAMSLATKLEDIASEVKQGNPGLSRYDNFQILMIILHEQEELEEIFISFFGLICPHFTISFGDKSIDFTAEGSEYVNGRIHTYNYQAIKTVLSELFLPQEVGSEEYNPANEAAAKIAEKLRKAKEQIKNARKSDKDDNTSIIALYISTLAVGMCMNINELYSYTLFQIYDVYNRYWLKSKYDMYMKISTTPMMDTSQMEEPRQWAQNLYGVVDDGQPVENVSGRYDLT